MPTTIVTITGADDHTDPKALVALSKEFPFVEWAVLLSASRMGTPRYPSRAWLMGFEDVSRDARKQSGSTFRYAVHFCGQCTRDTLAGDARWIDDITPDRIQLNGFKRTDAFVNLAKRLCVERPTLSFILQAGDLAGLLSGASTALEIGGATSVLFDPSGGRGIATVAWPVIPGVHLGYAGGIGPDNVTAVLQRLRQVCAPETALWIDMESRVRNDDDKLDTARVCMVLSKAHQCILEAA